MRARRSAASVCVCETIMAAAYVEILRSEFPDIDSELFDYITGERPNRQSPRAPGSAGFSFGEIRRRDSSGSRGAVAEAAG